MRFVWPNESISVEWHTLTKKLHAIAGVFLVVVSTRQVLFQISENISEKCQAYLRRMRIMQKDFDHWNRRKKYLEEHGLQSLAFHERDVWWCSLGLNLGYEQDGKHDHFERPVLVLKKFNSQVAWVLPMTSKQKNNRFHFLL